MIVYGKLAKNCWEGSKCEPETVPILRIWVPILLTQGFGVQSQLSCTHTSIHPSTDPSTHPTTHPSIRPSVRPSSYLFTQQ